jgi:exodeoxyribonuclease-3
VKIVSFNANGIRSRTHQLQRLVADHQPDIIGVQETKVQDAEFPVAVVHELGYQAVFHGQKGHYGVAVLSRVHPLKVFRGFPGEEGEAQRRLITATYPLTDGRTLTVLNGYFPQGENRDHEIKFAGKQKFYANLLGHLRQDYDPTQLLVVLGDMNVAPLDQDVGIGAENTRRWLRTGKCSFLPEERDWLAQLLEWGLVDTYRSQHPEIDDKFSWFDYRSRGFEREPKRGLRIDLVLATRPLAELCVDAGISYSIRSLEKPSDHCPVWARFDLN